ncbi:hypothetical protein BKA93DRAFT_771086 [Sparassis latifolia]
MSPPNFSLRLQQGIAGGFAPPTPSAIYTIDAAPAQSLLKISATVRLDGTPSLQSAVPKSLSASDTKTATLLEELNGILHALPTESPPGSEDIYGMDTSIAYMCGNYQWMNGGPQGCGGGTSSVQPTAEEMAKFKRAVEIVNTLVDEAS